MSNNVIKFPTARVREAMLIEKHWKDYQETVKHSGSNHVLDLTATKRVTPSSEELRNRQTRKALNFTFAYGMPRK